MPDPMQKAPFAAGLGRTSQDMIVTASGFVTSSLTALILAVVETKLGFAFYSIMWWFVIPAGALLSGFAGASGYYLGAKLFHHRPTRLLLFNMVSVGISTYLLVNWLNYSMMEIEGRSVSEMIPFTQYMDVMLSHQTMQFSIRGAKLGKTGDLGSLGYGIAALQVLGFAVGGFCVYAYLQAAPYCESCRKYLKKLSSTTRYTNDSEQLQELYTGLVAHLQQRDSAAASELVSAFGSPKPEDMKLNAELTLHKCATCPQEFVEISVNTWDGKDWKQISDLQIREYLTRS